MQTLHDAPAISSNPPAEVETPPYSDPTSKVAAAAEQLDWDALRKRSLSPGGFGADRASIWPKLLHVNGERAAADPVDEPHEDERQIRLDTDRSFVLYPVEETMDDREGRQRELNALIVQIFRRHPGLSYFQGYHDIITVLVLSLPPALALPAAEKVSMHRLRDSMGRTLEPLMGLMRILQRLLRLADPPYAALLEEQAPLPYAALSHLLTLFAHDVPTLPLIQHIFDFLFTRPPIAVVYLAAAIILARKEEVEALEREGEEGMIHSVLTGLPDLVDRPQGEEDVEDEEVEEDAGSRVLDRLDDPLSSDLDTGEKVNEEADAVPEPDPPSSSEPELESDIDDATGGSDIAQGAGEPSISKHTDLSIEQVHPVADEVPVPEGITPETDPASSPPVSETSDLPSSSSRDPSPSPTPIPSPPAFGSPPLPPTLLNRSPSPSPPPPPLPRRAKRSLPALLEHADALLAQYPPTYPALALERTMGRASAMRTWSERPVLLPPDDAAEALVVAGTDIVLPWAPEHDAQPVSSEDEGAAKGWFRRRRGKERADEKERKGGEGRGRKRRRLQKRNRPVFGARVERKTMLAGAALVLGVAMAVSVYGMHGRSAGGVEGEFRRAGRVLGGLLGVGERLWHMVGVDGLGVGL